MYLLPLFADLGKGKEGANIVMATPIADIICCITAIILFVVYLKGHAKVDKHVVEE